MLPESSPRSRLVRSLHAVSCLALNTPTALRCQWHPLYTRLCMPSQEPLICIQGARHIMLVVDTFFSLISLTYLLCGTHCNAQVARSLMHPNAVHSATAQPLAEGATGHAELPPDWQDTNPASRHGPAAGCCRYPAESPAAAARTQAARIPCHQPEDECSRRTLAKGRTPWTSRQILLSC